ncbi:serine protease [Paenalcaligenes niemegkensis]|uniref:S1 family peptidase n=1 Tax=Paenalcaligenes niemegkensis TaxID=2895469 RepID=UPI001EE961B5|nr:serine protease [Paenalcaligenes niemegkensis]MCQ9616644.1 serine protease [Paenalcaligenes niemegkensis]
MAGSAQGDKSNYHAKSSTLDAHATGVFLNGQGDVMTVHHAIQHCGAVYVVKDNKVVAGTVHAVSPEHDLAVLRTPLKPYLNAVFVIDTEVPGKSQAVFAEGYNVVQRMPNRASIVFNAMSDPDNNELSLLSPVQPGSSGTPVLSEGLVLGMVVERVAPGFRSSGTTTLSQVGRSVDIKGQSRVKAVSTERIKKFLLDNDIVFSESNAPQLGRLQAQASRAATLTVGIICG